MKIFESIFPNARKTLSAGDVIWIVPSDVGDNNIHDPSRFDVTHVTDDSFYGFDHAVGHDVLLPRNDVKWFHKQSNACRALRLMSELARIIRCDDLVFTSNSRLSKFTPQIQVSK